MKSEISIDIICSVKNGDPYIAQMIDSVLNQTYQNWALMIVDDGSVDNTNRVLDSYRARDRRISWKKAENQGRGRALNLAVLAGTNKLVANLDADDIWLPGHLAQVTQAIDGGREFVAVGSLHRTFSGIDEVVHMLVEPRVSEYQTAKDVTYECAYHNPINHSSVLIRRDALLAVGGYDESRKSQFDYDLWVRLAIAGGKLGRLSQLSVLKRVHEAQSFEVQEHRSYVRSSLNIQKRFIEHFGGGVRARGALAMRRVWGEFPRGIRMAVRRLIRRDD